MLSVCLCPRAYSIFIIIIIFTIIIYSLQGTRERDLRFIDVAPTAVVESLSASELQRQEIIFEWRRTEKE